jgi:hypothetical protein
MTKQKIHKTQAIMTTPKYESKVICCHKRSLLFTHVLDLRALITSSMRIIIFRNKSSKLHLEFKLCCSISITFFSELIMNNENYGTRNEQPLACTQAMWWSATNYQLWYRFNLTRSLMICTLHRLFG